MANLIKRLLWRAGLDVRLVRNVAKHDRLVAADRWRREWGFLENYRVRTVLDIGANTGQFAAMLHGLYPSAAILAFEPVAACRAELETCLRTMPKSRLFPFALGDENGTAVLNRSEFTPCSSLLTPNARLAQEIPAGARTAPESVEMRRLDDLAKDLPLQPDVLVKIDVQGYELHVIRGAERTLGQAAVVAIETTFYEQYEAQPLFGEIHDALRALGFVYRGSAGQYESPLDHRFCYADAIFERRPSRG